jgi:hypothetical protein
MTLVKKFRYDFEKNRREASMKLYFIELVALPTLKIKL